MNSGRIWLSNDQIHYESQDYGSWSMFVSDLRVFGEYTTDNGPMIDDWFLVFLNSTGWFEASVYAEGVSEFRDLLALRLGTDSLYGDLAVSTDFASRIIWPQTSFGRELFIFTSVPSPWWRSIFRFGGGEMSMALTPEAAQHTSAST